MKNNIFALTGKVAIVTGGSRGIGKVIAGYLADAGAAVALISTTDASDVATGIQNEYGVKAKSYCCDVTSHKEIEHCISEIVSDFGTVDLLFNNAGICIHKDVLESTEEEWKKVMDVNLNGVFYFAQNFCRYLVREGKKGNIVNMASMSGSIVNLPQPQASYNASKAAVIHLTKSLAVELASKGIRVNSVSPGYIETELTITVRSDWQDTWREMIPFKRMGNPSELAGAVIYLMSEASSYTSGSNLVIDGCYSAV